MIIEQANYVETYSISDAWREVMWLCVKKGYDYVVEKGSYAGQIRRQLPYVTIRIKEPGKRPLAPIMPPGLPLPTDEKKIEEYFYEYLTEDKLKPNEQYTYGSYIKPQLPKIIDILITSRGNTNQARMSIGDRDSVNLDDPPCLRVITFKVVEKKLNMSVFFGSWDLFSGVPRNLGGLQMLKEYVFAHLPEDMGVSDGELIAYSDGLHIYEYAFELANLLNVDKIAVSEKVRHEKEGFAKILDSRSGMVDEKNQEPPAVYKKECSG